MATWTAIPNASLEPGAPARSLDAIALRDNDVYLRSIMAGTEAEKIANAALVAIEDAKLSTSATTTGRDWVLNRTALADVGAVGTYAFLYSTGGLTYTAGQTVAGSALRYACVSNAPGVYESGTPAGTWRCMGYAFYSLSGPENSVTLWLRVS